MNSNAIDCDRIRFVIKSFNLGSPYLQASGGDSPKLSGFVAPPSHLAPSHFGGTFSPLSTAAHAFNLAAFRTPGFLGAHGFAAFGANIGGGYRDHSPNSFDGNISSGGGGGGGSVGSGGGAIVPLNTFNTNSNSPTNQYSSARSSISPTARDAYLNSDYYHHNNNTTTTSTTATNKLTDSHSNSEHLTSDRHHLHSQHTPTNNHYHNSNHQHHHHNHHHHHHQHNNSNNNNHSISNSNHNSFERAASESPALSVNEPRCSSPVESLRSYPTSQKSDEGGSVGGGGGGGGSGVGVGYHSPSHPDSVGSRSPENLSASATSKKSVGDMLDHHKIPLSFLGQPLAALHSMTEMKSASNNGGNGGGGNAGNANITGNGHGMQQTQSHIGSHGAANPHGIDTILSRPPPVTSAGLNALTSGKFSKQFHHSI